MQKPNLSSASADTLLKLRDEIAEVLVHRAALLREELSKLGRQIGSKGKFRGSSLKGRKVAVKYRDKSLAARRGVTPRGPLKSVMTLPNQGSLSESIAVNAIIASSCAVTGNPS